jgi:hypothetical protein
VAIGGLRVSHDVASYERRGNEKEEDEVDDGKIAEV